VRISPFHIFTFTFRQINQCKRERWNRILAQDTFFNEVPCPPALRFTISWRTGGLIGVIQRSMPTVCQVALLDIIRRSLQPEGEATRLILHCWHAGGVSTAVAGGVGVCDQALIILDRRYSAETVVLDPGDDARRLYELSWPSELSIEAYNIHFNKALCCWRRKMSEPSGRCGRERPHPPGLVAYFGGSSVRQSIFRCRHSGAHGYRPGFYIAHW
jgi:hypothetical protein